MKVITQVFNTLEKWNFEVWSWLWYALNPVPTPASSVILVHLTAPGMLFWSNSHSKRNWCKTYWAQVAERIQNWLLKGFICRAHRWLSVLGGLIFIIISLLCFPFKVRTFWDAVSWCGTKVYSPSCRNRNKQMIPILSCYKAGKQAWWWDKMTAVWQKVFQAIKSNIMLCCCTSHTRVVVPVKVHKSSSYTSGTTLVFLLIIENKLPVVA